MEDIRDEGTRNLVRSNEISLYPEFVIQKEFTYNLLARIQGPDFSCNSRKFVIKGVCYSGIPL